MNPNAGSDGKNSSGISAYTNFGKSAGPVVPPTIPFAFGRGAFGRSGNEVLEQGPLPPVDSVQNARNRSPTRAAGNVYTYRPVGSSAVESTQRNVMPRSPVMNSPPMVRSPTLNYMPRSPMPIPRSSVMPMPRSPVMPMPRSPGMPMPRSPGMPMPGSSGMPMSRSPGMPMPRSKSPVLNTRPRSPVLTTIQRPPMVNQSVQEKPFAPRLPAMAISEIQRQNARSKSPPPSSLSHEEQQNFRAKSPPPSSLSNEEQQKDDEAKARRLQRFKQDQAASETVVKVDTRRNKASGQPISREGTPVSPMELEGLDTFNDDRDWRSAEPILGLCTDMCPEVERSERERKGDLDRYERLDGERNQTSKDLAVKKYTRTAEKEAGLIRPLPVLRLTMTFLLGLLDKFYDDDLLALYNFLWDRMRAVRMDLRMQHIFNQEAVIMHEQMIRFHILAMHELCEYSKGEGFSEGFDAHLNIEQMNKASVDLFQMYDEHRHQGDPLPNEAEFRGYYALLKLDKHPGYLVEPAELSLELVKMSPDMRNSDEVFFARKVARSCRLPNYIAFFRLARKATYLQACLMHAHFAKLRTQALASLYSGLAKSQGIPLSQIASWLGMERQEAEDLLAYHGFSIKQFEEPYMVKEGAFLNSDRDYRTQRSRLVESKRSLKMVNDVMAQRKNVSQADWFSEIIRTTPLQSYITGSDIAQVTQEQTPPIVEEEMPDYEEEEQRDWDMQDHIALPDERLSSIDETTPNVKTDSIASEENQISLNKWVERGTLISKSDEKNDDASVDNWVAPYIQPVQEKPRKRQRQSEEQEAVEHSPKRHEITNFGALATDDSVRKAELERQEEQSRLEEERIRQEEARLARAKLWLRRWKLRTDVKVQAARLRQKKAQAALSSMPLGFTIHGQRQISTNITNHDVRIDLNHVREQRMAVLDSMWTYLDVLSLISPLLKMKNPQATSMCWKLVICSGILDTSENFRAKSNTVGQWLRSKLLKDVPKVEKRGYSSVPETYVSKDVINGVCCCFIAKDVAFDENKVKSGSSLYGTNAILFLVGEDCPLHDMRTKLHSLVNALPAGTSVPLLILTSLHEAKLYEQSEHLDQSKRPPLEEELAIRLQLHRLDRDKISSWIVLPATGKNDYSSKGFYCTETLIKGIKGMAALALTQPDLRSVDLRDLVLEHLQLSLKSLQHSKVGPQQCILAFNQALDDSVEELYRAARSSPSHWPPPELGSAPEDWPQSSFPYYGWNDDANLQPVYDALQFCHLPAFPPMNEGTPACSPDISSDSLHMRSQYMSLLAALEQYLSNLGDDSFEAKHAAQSVLDGAVTLDWSEAGCQIFPDWIRIFQSVYHTRLMLLNSEPPPIVYVLRNRRQKDETSDYERKLTFASQLRGGLLHKDVPDRTDESISDFDEGDNRQYNIVEERQVAMQNREVNIPEGEVVELDAMIADELHYLESGEHQKLLHMASSVNKEPVFSVTDVEAQLEMLVAEVHRRLDKNTDAEEDEVDVKQTIDSDQPIVEYVLPRLAGPTIEQAGSASAYEGSSGAYKKFADVLNSCQSFQLSVSRKLGDYFGVPYEGFYNIAAGGPSQMHPASTLSASS